ncbi:MAG TPA: 7-cyano-7-deazaguanine synthase [Microlunatus sp.]|nr:7-cyano-7-deazaguanine synthase [Microlunatus sp.]
MYLVDKRFLRAHTADGWTRPIELAVHLTEPSRWGEPELTELNALLGMLTSDRWTISVRDGAWPPQPGLDFGRAGEVALFSGGLDSTAYAVHAARRGGTRLLLLAFDDALQARQREIAVRIERVAEREVRLLSVGQTVAGGPSGDGLEPSSRSRGFLYTAGGIYVAAAHQLTEVAVPENGQLAVNPPLMPGRLGALSTRSVHPWTLSLMNRLITGIGGDVRVVNPLLDSTKGEVCRLALDANLDRTMLERTISCGNPRDKRFAGFDNCGRCFPCLVRRSGLIHANGADSTPYRYDLADLAVVEKPSRDLRALMRWLSTSFGLRDLIADSPFPPDVLPPTVLPVLHRGRRELATMIERLVPNDHPFRQGWAPVIEPAT